ncbi:MAG: PH domain-containing protein [Alphaproteobacteria bacterium]|nr:PH domain-containing protein [Alphaproteobacteria bacterium]
MFYKRKRKEYNLDNLFVVSDDMNELSVSYLPIFENFLRIVFRISLFVLLFAFFNEIGDMISSKQWFFGDKGFDTSFLYSVFLVPLLYSLRDIVNCFDAWWTRIYIGSKHIVVKGGLFYKKYDKLYVKDIDNAELHRTCMGSLFGYSTLTLYAPGGLVVIPFIKDNERNFERLNKLIKKIDKNQ